MPPVLFLALLAAQRKAARFAFLAAVPCGSLPLHGLLLALGGQRLPGLCAGAPLRQRREKPGGRAGIGRHCGAGGYSAPRMR